MNENDRHQPLPFSEASTLALPAPGFIDALYRRLDLATDQALSRLKAEQGIVPSCRAGCCACCKQHILATKVEARALTGYIRREFSASRIRALHERTRRWHLWDRRRLQRSTSTDGPGVREPERHLACPLLYKGICSIYPMRPITCRTHFVSTPARYCQHDNDPKLSGRVPRLLSSVVLTTNWFSAMIRYRIEAGGDDYLKSIMLLPHWLSIEMGWHFDSSF